MMSQRISCDRQLVVGTVVCLDRSQERSVKKRFQMITSASFENQFLRNVLNCLQSTENVKRAAE